MARIHPTAVVDLTAQLGDDVEVGAYAIIEADVTIGPGTVIRPHAVVRRYTMLGAGNFVDSFVSLGGEPQDLKFDPQTVSTVRIGDHNTFREGVTISRATGEGRQTVVGNHTYWMANSHAGHNAEVCDNAILVNGALVAGHAVLGPGAILAGNCAIHQFCWVGERTMFQGGAMASTHVPPYSIVSGINGIVSLNLVGLKRAADLTDKDRKEIREAFRLLYLSGLSKAEILRQMDACTEWGPAAGRYREFIHRVYEAAKPYNRGLSSLINRSRTRHGGGED